MAEWTAKVTRTRPGLGERYATFHRTIPEVLDDELHRAGVESWRIWRDGDVLFHVVKTSKTWNDFIQSVQATEVLDAQWKKQLDDILDGSEVHLPLVWQTDVMGQHAS